jgi:hypothetical protein
VRCEHHLISVDASFDTRQFWGPNPIILRTKAANAGAVVLEAPSPDAKRCFDNALEARKRARKANDPRDREFYLDSERRWLKLAESYQYSARLSLFLKQPSDLPNHPICATCAVPMWMKRMNFVGGLIEYRYECPACEAKATCAVPLRSEQPGRNRRLFPFLALSD